ncbi:MAG: oligopeptide ABC transporter ATP-binding protein, partial [Mesorhizobium sp.]
VPMADGRVVACHVRAQAIELQGQSAAAGNSLATTVSAITWNR